MIQKGWNTGTSLQNLLDTVSSLSFIFDPCAGSKALRGRLSNDVVFCSHLTPFGCIGIEPNNPKNPTAM